MIVRNPRRRRLAALGARLGFVVSLVAFTLGIVAMIVGSPPVAAAPTTAAAQVISPTTDSTGAEIPGGGAPLTEGDSATEFTFRLPAGAACSGDSANDGFRVFGYLIGGSIDPASMSFLGTNGPLPEQYGSPLSDFRMPLYDVNGSPYQAAQTANADPPPGPGNVINIPTFSLKIFDAAENLPEGEYNLGIACVDMAAQPDPVLDKVWNTQITVVADPDDTGPVKIGWTAAAEASVTTLELTVDPGGEAAVGETVTLTATVDPAEATGTVTFKDGTTTLGDAEVDAGEASLDVDDLQVGDHTLVASFAPETDAPFEPSTSEEVEYSITSGDPGDDGSTTTTTSTTATDSSTTTTVPVDASGGGTFGGGASGGAISGSSITPLAYTGTSLSLTVWGVLLLVFGRMAILLGRTPRVRTVAA